MKQFLEILRKKCDISFVIGRFQYLINEKLIFIHLFLIQNEYPQRF